MEHPLPVHRADAGDRRLLIQLGTIAALFRYPVKSMGGESIDSAELGWHGLEGDRRFAFRRVDDRSGFPWLTASRLPALVQFQPSGDQVRTPEGQTLPIYSDALAADVAGRIGAAVQMTHLNRGIFDEAALSVITDATIAEVGKRAAVPADVRRFRPNVLLASAQAVPFEEDGWVGGVIAFGEGADAATVAVTNRDERCAMVNFDPDSGRAAPEVLKAIVRTRDNKAGVYATVVRRGTLAVGQSVLFRPY